MNNLRQRFTKWYYRKGHRMTYKPCDYADGVAELVFHCPLWIRPLVHLLFSPCTYYREVGNEFAESFNESIAN